MKTELITARGKVIVSLCLSVHTWWGGGSGSAGGGSGPAGRGGRSASPAGGGRGGGQVQQAGGGGSAKIAQQNEYSLLHGGRYASCVHAGGLSCILIVFLFWIEYTFFINFDKYLLWTP